MQRLVAPTLLVLFALAPVARARDVTGPAAGAGPEKNFSNIHADVEWVVKAFKAAEESARAGAWSAAVRKLQTVVDASGSRESSGDAAPYVRPVFGTSVYEGAWIVARHTVARLGAAALTAYQAEFGAASERQLAMAVQRRDEPGLVEVAKRFMPLPAGRRAALLLADVALERGDTDRALDWLEALEDLETASTEAPEVLAPWRTARIQRHAVALARDAAAVAPIVKALTAARIGDDHPPYDIVPRELQRRPAPLTTWSTTGGNAQRTGLTPSLGSRFRLKWFKPPDGDDDLIDSRDPDHTRRDRPSVWLPPRAVASEKHLFVSDGEHLHIYDIETGARMFERSHASRYPGARRAGINEDNDQDRRIRLGLLEGHALSLHAVKDFESQGSTGRRTFKGAGQVVFAAVPDGNEWPFRRSDGHAVPPRNDHIQAYHWSEDDLAHEPRLVPLWSAGGQTAPLGEDTRIYGAPLVYRGRVWIAGIRPAKATNDRLEAWIFAFNLQSGQLEIRTHVGTGTPVRMRRVDEVIPTSPVAERGRVVVGTSLGMIAAVDAEDGRIRWIYRYDRAVEAERGRRRNRDLRDERPRASSFSNEPPLLRFDRCFFAPTDGNHVLILHSRPRGSLRGLRGWRTDRMNFANDFMAEHIAGVALGADGRHHFVIVGKGEHSEPPGPIVASRDALAQNPLWPLENERKSRKQVWWDEVSPTGFGPDPYGRALVTEAEVFVPTYHGILIYELSDRNGDGTHYLGILNTKDFRLPPDVTAPPAPYGNLIPIPGRGLVSVSATTVAFWARR